PVKCQHRGGRKTRNVGVPRQTCCSNSCSLFSPMLAFNRRTHKRRPAPLPTNACVSEEFAPDEPGWGERGYAPGAMFCLLVAMGSMTPDLETRMRQGALSCRVVRRKRGCKT